MRTEQTTWTIEREDADGNGYSIEVVVNYEVEPYYPPISPSMSDPGAPAEGGNIYIIDCVTEDGTEIVPTATEQKLLIDHLYDLEAN